jgi:GH15 family glucan-1,4-alpha-glucosidase
VRLFFHYDWHIWNDIDANTVFYYPYQQALVAYKLKAYFLMNGQVRCGDVVTTGINSWATGVKEVRGAEGTWRDAEDGELGRNPIAQGSVDGTLAFHIPTLAAQENAVVDHWLAVGEDLPAVVELDTLMRRRGPESFLSRTRSYWYRWANKDEQEDFANLSQDIINLYKQSLLILRTQIDVEGAVVAANDSDILLFSNDTYSYMWPRDGALVANALSHAGYSDITRSFFDFCNGVLTDGGYLLHKYNPDRSWGSSWQSWIDQDGQPQLPIQEDETALVLYSLWQHYTCFHNVEFVAPHYRTLVTPAADFLVSYREAHTGLPDASYDLWEERRGILTYTTATVYAGLEAAANFSVIFGEKELAQKYHQAASDIKDAALLHLWDEERGHFLRMISVDKHGNIQKDATLDSSLCGLFQFDMLPADDPRVERTMQALERTLMVKTPVGGMARYENDYYHQVTRDTSVAQGNPWFICTLWLAQYRIAHAKKLDDLSQALPLMEWALKHALPSGVMAEQIHPFTGEPLSVSPLTWSHAEFVLTVRWYVGKFHKLQSA